MAPYAIAYAIPILITALGGMFAERCGIINIALDGIMIFGALSGALCVTLLTELCGYNAAASIGILLAIVVGILFSLLLAFASIQLNANQTICGTALNLLAAALGVYLSRQIVGVSIIVINSLPRFDVPILSSLPVIGPILFRNTYVTTWLVFGLTVLSWYVIERTPFGLRLRACGEYPESAEAAGIHVARIRYAGVMISGAFAGLGGAIYALTIAGQSTGNVNGLGFVALAGLIFGQWRTFGVLFATLFFGMALTVAQISTLWPSLAAVPPLFLRIFPYVVTLLVLIFFSKSSRAPRAEGKYFAYKK
ncbi:MAG TPA: ABC transporter permease [Candidatus Onthomonas avicola]|nr:ABC transporter permease [Candidatus Onthomonas avicola]